MVERTCHQTGSVILQPLFMVRNDMHALYAQLRFAKD